MKVTILGASGKTGVELVNRALAAGHQVVGLVRHAATNDKPSVGYTEYIGDATNVNDVASASKDSDIIVSTLGVISNKSSLQTDAVRAVIAASKKTGVKKFVVESAYTVEPEHTKPLLRFVTQNVMKGMIADKSKSEDLLRESDLTWTIVRPVTLTNSKNDSDVRVLPENEMVGFTHKISRRAVAGWMLTELENDVHSKESVTISQ